MSTYLFDTNAFSIFISNNIPEKWQRYWKEVRFTKRRLILFESLISEVFYKNSEQYGFKAMKDKIGWIKTFPSSRIVKITNDDAIRAGEYMVTLRRYGLSLVDSYILALGNKYNAKIITTDPGIKQAGKKLKIKIDYIPFEKV